MLNQLNFIVIAFLLSISLVFASAMKAPESMLGITKGVC